MGQPIALGKTVRIISGRLNVGFQMDIAFLADRIMPSGSISTG